MSPLALALQESHQDLQRWFLYHQECLLLAHDNFARQSLAAFSEYLTTHLRFENQQLLPCFSDNSLLQWPVTVYVKEHEKLLSMLANIEALLQDYVSFVGRKKRLALLTLLDVEQAFCHVMEHHEQREEKDLFVHINMQQADLFSQWHALEMQLQQRHAAFQHELESFLATSNE